MTRSDDASREAIAGDGSTPLSGVRVLDMTRFVAGPYCTLLLAEAGADVIKVEPPEGEDTRRLDPIITETAGGVQSGYFLRFNRGKRSAVVDLRTTAGKGVFADLVRNVDVLVENYRPGVLARLGFDTTRLHDLNPRLVYCSISGFGHSGGPYGSHPAFAILAEVLAGVLVHNPRPGEPPIWTGLGLGDLFPAALSVGGVAMALYQREKTGSGCHVDMAMYDGMISLNERAMAFSGILGHDIRLGQQEMIAPFGLFKASDGYLCVAVIGERVWAGLCNAIDRPDLVTDPRLCSGRLRADNLESTLLPILDGWLSARTRQEASDLLLAAGVPAGPVRFASEIVSDPQAQHREMVTETSFSGGATYHVAGNPIRIVPGHKLRGRPVPDLGAHTVEVLHEVAGYDHEHVEALLREGAVRDH